MFVKIYEDGTTYYENREVEFPHELPSLEDIDSVKSEDIARYQKLLASGMGDEF